MTSFCKEHKRKIGHEKRPARNQSDFEAEWRRLCGVPGIVERLVVSSPPVRGVWPHWMLRQFSEPACIEACGGDRPSDYCQLRAGRGLVLRLRKAGDDQRRVVASAAFASHKSGRTWTRRTGAGQLGVTSELARDSTRSLLTKRPKNPTVEIALPTRDSDVRPLSLAARFDKHTCISKTAVIKMEPIPMSNCSKLTVSVLMRSCCRCK